MASGGADTSTRAAVARAGAGAGAGAAVGVAVGSGGGWMYTYSGVSFGAVEINGSRGWCHVTSRECMTIPVSASPRL